MKPLISKNTTQTFVLCGTFVALSALLADAFIAHTVIQPLYAEAAVTLALVLWNVALSFYSFSLLKCLKSAKAVS